MGRVAAAVTRLFRRAQGLMDGAPVLALGAVQNLKITGCAQAGRGIGVITGRIHKAIDLAVPLNLTTDRHPPGIAGIKPEFDIRTGV